MNIFRFIEDSLDLFYIQPDTVLCSEKHKVLQLDTEGLAIEGKEITTFKYYVPDAIKKLIAIPFVYVKIDRPLKAIHSEFAHRHYNTCGYGVHLVSNDIDEGSVLDGSLFLSAATEITASKKASSHSNSAPYDGFESFDTAIERVSRHISLRTGDLVTLDLPTICTVENSQTLNYQELSISIIF